MDIQNEILEQRWAMLTNPFAMPVPLICKVTEGEIIEHSFLLDAITKGQQLNDSQMKQCRVRFRRFCETQWLNRNRN